MPALSRLYGILPWHIDGPEWLSFPELAAYMADLTELAERGEL